MARSGTWRLTAASSSFAWAIWDGEAVVYDERLALTHYIGPAALAVLQALEGQSGATCDELIERLRSAGHSIEPNAEDLQGLRDLLDGLNRCGLAEFRAS